MNGDVTHRSSGRDVDIVDRNRPCPPDDDGDEKKKVKRVCMQPKKGIARRSLRNGDDDTPRRQ